MAKKLAQYVTVYDDNGQGTEYGPEDSVPAEVAKKITNPAAWEGGEVPGVGEEGGPPVPGVGQTGSEDTGTDAGGGQGGGSYGSMKKAELQAAAEAKGLSTEGTNAELIERLEAADAGGGQD